MFVWRASRGDAVFQHAMVLEVHSGVDRGPAGAAGDALGKVITKDHAFGCQRIEIGRFDSRVIQHRQALPPPLISSDE